MLHPIINHFCFGLFACFIGGLPFGLINMSVVNITIKRSTKSATFFALGASLIEIVEASIAIVFGLAIEGYLRNNELLQILICVFFILLGVYFFSKKGKTKINQDSSSSKSGSFVKGMAVSALNPQAIPFWLFAFAYIAPYNLIDLIGSNLYFFLGGVFIGKLLALSLFIKGAKYIRRHLSESDMIINRAMGSIFIVIGIIQAIRYFF